MVVSRPGDQEIAIWGSLSIHLVGQDDSSRKKYTPWSFRRDECYQERGTDGVRTQLLMLAVQMILGGLSVDPALPQVYRRRSRLTMGAKNKSNPQFTVLEARSSILQWARIRMSSQGCCAPISSIRYMYMRQCLLRARPAQAKSIVPRKCFED